MKGAVYLALLLSFSTFTLAQQTVFNVPSGDVMARGKIYGELDFSYRATNNAKTFTPRVVFGVGHHLEAGVNINGIVTAGVSQSTITPAIKWRSYDGGENGWGLLIGDNLFIPVQNRTYNVGTYAYVEAVKSWKSNTRATFGAYYASRNVFALFQRAGGQFALEQTVNKRLTLAADWFTGNSSVGYITPGAILKLTERFTFYVAYQVGNSGTLAGNHQLLAEVGWNLN